MLSCLARTPFKPVNNESDSDDDDGDLEEKIEKLKCNFNIGYYRNNLAKYS